MPSPSSRAALAPFLLAGLVSVSCGEDAVSPNEPERLPNAASLIPAAPAPQPTPTPVPGSQPDDGPYPATPGAPGGTGEGGSATCGEPVPPPVSRFSVSVLWRQTDRVVLDSTPLVGPDADYCRGIGYTDGRFYCPVRPEGHPERGSCEAARVGRAADTGRIGPEWSANGQRCTGPGGNPSCLNHPDNQFLVFAYGAGRFRACAQNGACSEIVLP